jgi:CxxC motif-containing protein
MLDLHPQAMVAILQCEEACHLQLEIRVKVARQNWRVAKPLRAQEEVSHCTRVILQHIPLALLLSSLRMVGRPEFQATFF